MATSTSRSPRSVAFVDWSNVYLGAKNYYSVRIDPVKLRNLLSRDRNLTHVHYFSATDEASPGQARFHEWLTRHGFLVHTQRLEQRVNRVRCPTCTTDFDPVCPTCQTVRQLPPHKSKMTDIDLAKHLLILTDDYDEAVLVSGDKDFLPVIDWLRVVRNRKVVVFTWKQSFSGLLIGRVDGIEYLDGHIADLQQP